MEHRAINASSRLGQPPRGSRVTMETAKPVGRGYLMLALLTALFASVLYVGWSVFCGWMYEAISWSALESLLPSGDGDLVGLDWPGMFDLGGLSLRDPFRIFVGILTVALLYPLVGNDDSKKSTAFILLGIPVCCAFTTSVLTHGTAFSPSCVVWAQCALVVGLVVISLRGRSPWAAVVGVVLVLVSHAVRILINFSTWETEVQSPPVRWAAPLSWDVDKLYPYGLVAAFIDFAGTLILVTGALVLVSLVLTAFDTAKPRRSPATYICRAEAGLRRFAGWFGPAGNDVSQSSAPVGHAECVACLSDNLGVNGRQVICRDCGYETQDEPEFSLGPRNDLAAERAPQRLVDSGASDLREASDLLESVLGWFARVESEEDSDTAPHLRPGFDTVLEVLAEAEEYTRAAGHQMGRMRPRTDTNNVLALDHVDDNDGFGGDYRSARRRAQELLDQVKHELEALAGHARTE